MGKRTCKRIVDEWKGLFVNLEKRTRRSNGKERMIRINTTPSLDLVDEKEQQQKSVGCGFVVLFWGFDRGSQLV
jgi:hypothetical protein